MTELQLGLMGLGAIVVVGVLAFNKWQEYRHCRLARRALDAATPDVLLDGVPAQEESRLPQEAFEASPDEDTSRAPGIVPAPYDERIEPVFAGEPEASAGMPAEDEPPTDGEAPAFAADEDMPDRQAPVGRPQAATFSGGQAAEVPEPVHLLSPLVDFVAAIEAVEPVAAPHIRDVQRAALDRLRKPVRWYAYNEFTSEWEALLESATTEYRRLRVGLQLVDRQGVVAEAELSAFCIAMQDLADRLGGMVDFPQRQAALNAAAELDQFCAGVDIQIGVNVVSQGQPFAGTKIRALAESAGLTIDEQGRFVRSDETGRVLYLLLNQDAAGFSAETMRTLSTQGLTFLLDVPCVAHGDRVFGQMVELARRFAEVLHGVLVDDNRRPLSENALEPIRRQIAQYQAAMMARQLPPGTALTRRLFS